MALTRPEINAGALDRRITLLRPVYSDWGDEITGWESAAEVWASVLPEVEAERDAGGRTVAFTKVPVVIRYRADIDQRWRVQDGDRVYEIIGMADVARRRVQLSMQCREVQ